MKYIVFIIFSLGLMVSVVHADNEDSFKQMLSLAQQGDPTAQYHVGMFYNNGIGTSKDTKLAFEWFQKSAVNSNSLGAYKVGCYYSGQGQGFMDVNQGKALEYKLIAAKAGYTLAQYDVASIQFQNNNIDEGIKWLKMAGDQGDFDSLNALFSLYYQGSKTSKDLPAAYLYLKLAMKISTNDPPEEIKAVLGALIKNISEAERIKADNFVSEWKPKPTELTIKARKGLRDAVDYLKSHVHND